MNLICGINPVLEALGAGTRHFDRILVVKGIRNRRVSEVIARASRRGIPLRFEARETLDRMAGGIPHQGVMAVVSEKPVIDLDTLLAEAREPALVVVLDGVEDPRNLGAILRTVECAGADGVVVPERHSAGLSEAASRASAGALEYVKVARVGNVAQAIEAMKGRGLWVVGLDAEGAERWDAVDYRRPIALVLGGEGRGIRRLVRERCDHVVSLPLFGHVTSLNVSVVAGIALFEIVRQRGAVPSHVRPIPPRRLAPVEPIVGPSADDQEQDPGAVWPRGERLPAEAPEEEDDVAGLVAIHEEAAWGGGPVLLPPLERRRGRHHGRWGERPGPAPSGPRQPSSQAEPDRGRRHRRRRGRGRADAGGPGAPGAGAPERPGQGPAEGPPPARSPGIPGPEGAGGHRRRSRRRRRQR